MPALNKEITLDPAINMARQALYRFAALSLLDPKTGSWEKLDALRSDQMLAEASAFIRGFPDAVPEKMALGEQALSYLDPSLVLAQLPLSRQQYDQEYERTFGLLVSNACPPYETEYIDSKFTFQRSNTLADVSGFYSAFGLTISETLPERPDHIVQELEFMAFLIGMEMQAAAGDSNHLQERVDVCRQAQVKFFQDHLAWWVPVFSRLLFIENPKGFFALAGTFVSALMPVERALLGVEALSQPINPSSIEQPEACESCQLSALSPE